MLILLNTSKTLNFNSNSYDSNYSIPHFLNESNKLVHFLKHKNELELSCILHTNKKLTKLNYERFQKWNIHHNKNNSKQAIFTFTGTVFKGFDLKNYNKQNFDYLQKSLIILSGLYGIIKPLDLIQEYRLEMASSLNESLNKFWKEKITEYINDQDQNFILNLASVEYRNAIDFNKLNFKVITPVFKTIKNGNLKTVAIYSKQARGLLANYIIKNNINSIDEIKKFNENNYKHENKISSENELIFVNKK
jgi:uncharacterized protein